MEHEKIAARLSDPMREALILHVDALAPLYAVRTPRQSDLANSVRALRVLKLLRVLPAHRDERGLWVTPNRELSMLTDDGRLVLAYALGFVADTIREAAMEAEFERFPIVSYVPEMPHPATTGE